MKITNLAIDPNGIALDLVNGNRYKMNELGVEILNLLNQGKNEDEIAKILGPKFEIAEDELVIDIIELLTKLKIFGLVG